MTDPVEVFRSSANALQVASKYPPYVSYKTNTDARYGPITAKFSGLTVIKIADGRIVPHYKFDWESDEAMKQVSTPQPMPGTYDVLSYFGFYYRFSTKRPVVFAYVTNNKPLRYDTSTATERGVDAVVHSLADYCVAFDPDSTEGAIHLRLTPRFSTQTRMGISDVRIAAPSLLPTEVTYKSENGSFLDVKYGDEQGHYVIKHVSFHTRLPGIARLGIVSGDFETDYIQYTFTEV